MVKPCVSGCKGLETEICKKATRCSYVDGEKRKFCRLSRSFKMRGRDCSITRITTKKQNRQIIGRFMKNTSVKRKALFLKSKCPDAGLCMILGIDYKKILDYFEWFVNFEYVKSPIKSIGEKSSNGFINEIKYERNGYASYAILKSSKKKTSDNLAYEYTVGVYLNKWVDIYPCFLATYGLYYYKDDDNWQHVKDTQTIQPNVLKDSFEITNTPNSSNAIQTELMCKRSKYAAVLTQHISNAKSVSDMLNDHSFVMNEILYVLYQVYLPLSMLRENFTHYDLHMNNVLLYDVGEGRYIEYIYHLDDGTQVQFKSRYVAKIIDYGRSYFNDDNLNHRNSKKIRESLCATDACNENEKCGNRSGLGYLDPQNYTVGEGNFIVSTKRNISHDLRLLSLIGNRINRHFESELTAYESMMYEMFVKVVFNSSYGTNEVVASGKHEELINNVSDAELELRDIIQYGPVKLDNDKHYKNKMKLYTLHVYADGKTKMRIG